MISHFSPRRPDRRKGAALVIVLAFVVLVTGLILAFFSRAVAERQISNSSASQTKVDLSAQGAVDSIIADLKQEIAAGSTSYTGTDGVTIYLPTTPATAVPAIALTGTTGLSGASFAPNLLKRSAYGQAFYSGMPNYNLPNNAVPAQSATPSPSPAPSTIVYTAPNRAAKVPATSVSQNGRFISPARWNKALLLPKANLGSTSDFTPIVPPQGATTATNAFVAPDWILVARDGSNPAIVDLSGTNNQYRTSGTNPVTSRYAYVMYDEGGLLDMNVAGYPSVMGTGASAGSQVQGKGSLALADLTALTDSSGNPLLSTTQIDALIGWRNYASTRAPGPFPSPNFSTNPATASNYYNFITGNTKGFLTTNAFFNSQSQSDRMFTSRQQLIKLLSAIDTHSSALAAAQNALQYMGTFSRDLEQPSFVPEPNASNTAIALSSDPKTKRPRNTTCRIDVENGSDTCPSVGTGIQDDVNPSLLTIRDSRGRPILRRRFPLSRLALMDQAGQKLRAGISLPTSLQNQIYDYFGLAWDSTNDRWNYNHGSSTTIYRLSDFSTPAFLSLFPASSNSDGAPANPDGTVREPDLFETLKAVINCDSLAKQEGALEINPSPHSANGALIDGMIHNQLVQIGVNLIDQYDADNYPACIYFNSREYYGVENLPYLAGWQQMWYRMQALAASDISTYTANAVPPSTGTTYQSTVMIQPIIWNPHAPDATATTTPTFFRVLGSDPTDVAASVHPQVAKAWWTTDPHVQATFPATQVYHDANGMTPVWKATTYLYRYPDAIVDPAISALTFKTATGDAAFREPFRLHTLDYPAGSSAAADSGYAGGQITVTLDPTLVAADNLSNGVAIGFNCGKAWTGPSVDKTNTQNYLGVGGVNYDLKLKLQYKNPNASDTAHPYLTYDVINCVYNNSGNISTVDNTDVYPYLRAFRTCFRADPRTDRWGLFHMAVFPSTDQTKIPNGVTPLQMPGDNGVDGGFGNNAVPHYYLPQGITIRPNPSSAYVMGTAALGNATAPGWSASPLVPSDLMANLPRSPSASSNPSTNPNSGTNKAGANPIPPGAKLFYADADGVYRRGSGWNFSGTDGIPLYTVTNGIYDSRPVVLNRAFRSIAEMGYASSGAAWRELDFFSPESGNAALLDAFCLNDLDSAPTDVTVAGRVNLNTKQPKVLQALISGVSKAEGGTIISTEAQNAAQALVNWTSDTTSMTSGIMNKGPLRNRSELVGKFVYQVGFTPAVSVNTNQPALDGIRSYQGFSSMLTTQTGGVFATAADASIKRRCESVIRALADSGNTRTWNLLIDVIAQTGLYPANADLSKFIVQGETRYWVHVSIDRLTGNVIAKQVEQVSE